jgi:hypothetical protein
VSTITGQWKPTEKKQLSTGAELVLLKAKQSSVHLVVLSLTAKKPLTAKSQMKSAFTTSIFEIILR